MTMLIMVVQTYNDNANNGYTYAHVVIILQSNMLMF